MAWWRRNSGDEPTVAYRPVDEPTVVDPRARARSSCSECRGTGVETIVMYDLDGGQEHRQVPCFLCSSQR